MDPVEEKVILPIEPKEAKKPKTVVVTFTDQYGAYKTRGGGQINAGESASVPEEEAEQLIAAGAAVRYQEPSGSTSGAEKAMAHPTKDKMVHASQTK